MVHNIQIFQMPCHAASQSATDREKERGRESVYVCIAAYKRTTLKAREVSRERESRERERERERCIETGCPQSQIRTSITHQRA